jgi:hypothetical protein
MEVEGALSCWPSWATHVASALFGALVGFGASLLSEFAKHKVSVWRVRKALYREMAQNDPWSFSRSNRPQQGLAGIRPRRLPPALNAGALRYRQAANLARK